MNRQYKLTCKNPLGRSFQFAFAKLGFRTCDEIMAKTFSPHEKRIPKNCVLHRGSPIHNDFFISQDLGIIRK